MSKLRVDELESIDTGTVVPVSYIDTGVRADLANPAKGSSLVYLGGINQPVRMNDIPSNPLEYTLRVSARSTTHAVDSIFANHTAEGPAGSGYGFHALDSGDADGGGAIGGATSRSGQADAIVGNRRQSGPGHGVIGSRLESGDGDGVHGFKAGTGAGDGVYGYIVQEAQGHAVHGKHEGSVSGAGVYGERLNGAGPGPGVLGWAKGKGGSDSASVMGMKQEGDDAPAGLFDARGTGPALRAFATGSELAKAIESQTDVAATAPISNTFERGRVSDGTNVRVRTGAGSGGARTGVVVGIDVSVAPSSPSAGGPSVRGLSASIGSNVTGADSSIAIDGNNTSAGGNNCYAVSGVANGANTRNAGIYGNAVGGTTNWSGYFVGNVFHGGTLTPSDERLKDIHGEVDGASALASVLATKIYRYDKHAAWEDDSGVEQRQLVARNEIGPLAQEIREVTPDHVVEISEGGYLALSDRSELYQLKSAVQYLTARLRDLGVEV